MTVYSAYQVSGFLSANGMPGNRVTEFVAIAQCESGFRSDAVSPVGAIGLWQIMPFNAGVGGGSVGDLYDPLYNAKVAVLMSGHGANCAAWDTAYANIGASGRYSYLNWPERGSCAYSGLTGVSVAIGTHNSGGASPPSFPGLDGSLTSTVSKYQYLSTQVLPVSGGYLREVRTIVGRQFTR